MLRGIRTASANWLGKLVMGIVMSILAFSFAIWGIGDIFRGGGRSTVAKVGSTDISAEEFRGVYNERLQQIAQRAGRPIPPDQARALGLDRQILAQLITERALDEWTRRLGLGITDTEVARSIREFREFQTADGQFSHDQFLQAIRRAGFTEIRFINQRRREMVRQHLMEAVGGLTTAPRALVDAIHAFQNERRTVDYVKLTAAQAGEIPEPTPEELSTYFDGRKMLFRAPEFRRLVILRLTPDDVGRWITVSDEDAKRTYDERRSRYVTPGRRHVQQIIFSTEDEALAAKKRLEAGETFEKIARERDLSDTDIDLGMVTRAAFASAPAVADAVFGLPEGGVSAPVQSRLGFAIVRVLKIEADAVKTFEEAAAEIRLEIARERTRTEIGQRHDRLEDERAGGATLAEAAQKIGLTAAAVEAVDRSGRDPAGAPVAGLPREVDVLTPAFAATVGVEADALRLPDGGYVWFEVTSIMPSKERPLEEVRERVAARWRDDQIGDRLRKKADAMLERLKADGNLAELAAQDGLKVETATGLARNATSEVLPPAAVSLVFRTQKGRSAAADGQASSERIVFRVTEVSVDPADAGTPAAQRAEENLRAAEGEDLLRQYLAFVEREIGATINTDVLRRVSGGESF